MVVQSPATELGSFPTRPLYWTFHLRLLPGGLAFHVRFLLFTDPRASWRAPRFRGVPRVTERVTVTRGAPRNHSHNVKGARQLPRALQPFASTHPQSDKALAARK